MATAALRRGLWLAATLVASSSLVMLALTGRRPEPGLTRFEAAGVMLAIPVEVVTAIDVRAAEGHWRFERTDGGWRVGSGSATPSSEFGTNISTGLHFLHVSAPQRRLTGAELETTFLADFGLDPPRYVVTVETSDARTLSVAFGVANPQGLAQYAQVGSEPDVILLPRYVGETWEAATGLK